MGRKKSNPDNYEIIPVTINGIEYLTLPQTIIFTGMNREVLRQRMTSTNEHFKIEHFKIEPYYIFIPYKVCQQLKERQISKSVLEKLNQLYSTSEINELIDNKIRKHNKFPDNTSKDDSKKKTILDLMKNTK
jgi:hypothetical protein